MNPRYPILIPSKGRHRYLHTMRAFDAMGVEYTVVVEPQEYDAYAAALGEKNLLVTPHQNKGLTVTRNWIWDYVQEHLGTERYWTFDDNIRGVYRLHKNKKHRVMSGTPLAIIEDFVDRYENIYIAGMHYESLAPKKTPKPPYLLNRRVYSNMLIQTDIPYRNKLFYNDDTDLCLQILKDGNCTIIFYAFLADKIASLAVNGGMTDYYKQTDKRLEFAKELQQAHPDVTRIVRRYGRWHHFVDYRPFRANRPIKKKNISIPSGSNEYGFILKDVNETTQQ